MLVNEIFQTLQGEATHTGRPSVFIRLQGCEVGCPWCDTKHTWETGEDRVRQISIADMLAKTADSAAYADMNEDELCDAVMRFTARHVVVTGGEPCIYNLFPLSKLLWLNDCSVQIETSGTEWVSVQSQAWVTVSPKMDMPGHKIVRADAVERANEIKMPIGKPADVDKLLYFIDTFKPEAPIWVQPISTSERATELCIKAATKHGWRVSVQAHKFLGVR
jgi:7-carboxy-7-deazaguanine synthase